MPPGDPTGWACGIFFPPFERGSIALLGAGSMHASKQQTTTKQDCQPLNNMPHNMSHNTMWGPTLQTGST